MNYRHIYHAGNFADVFKHSILVLLLGSLLRKSSPFCYIDTHAGLGIYDLRSLLAQKTLEYESGVARILNFIGGSSKDYPEEIIPYLVAIKNINKSNLATHFYPGSPFIARSMLRAKDRMVLMELHNEDIFLLKKAFIKDKQVAVHHYDGYRGLKAFLPPKERRGLVLIDPAFEQKNEFDLILSALGENVKSRWPTGIYALWYPIKDRVSCDKFLQALKTMSLKYLVCEMTIDKPTGMGKFVGCGMVIINPPWKIEKELKRVLSWLWKVLSPLGDGGWSVTV